MSELLPADFAIFAIAAVLAVTGLFRGLSGVVAFLAGLLASSFAVTAVWGLSQAYFDDVWKRALTTFVVSLLAFGLVRMVFAKFIHVLVLQPGESVLGFLLGAAGGLSLFLVWAAVGQGLEYSAVAASLGGMLF